MFTDRIPSRRAAALIGVLTALMIAALAVTLFRVAAPGYAVGSFGSIDFIEYWSAYQVFLGGGNPYDPGELLRVQRLIGSLEAEATMMWNPPWTLALLSPVLDHQFPVAARLWFALNLVWLGLTCLMLWSIYSRRRETLPLTALAVAAFLPSWSALALGQMSVFLAFGGTLLLWSLVRDRPYLAALGIAILSIKPHLSYLVVLTLGCWSIYRSKIPFILASVCYLGALLAATWALSPAVFGQWFAALSQPDSALHTPVVSWRSATLVGAVRGLFSGSEGVPTLPLVLVPGICGIAAFSLCTVRQYDFRWELALPLLFAASLLTSPLGWIFDYSMLSMLQVSALFLVLKRPSPTGWAAIAGMALLTFAGHLLGSCCIKYQHEYLWFPIGLVACWLLAWRGSEPLVSTGTEEAS